MRFVSWPALLFVALGACSSSSGSLVPADASTDVSLPNGDPAACTSVGGTCQPFSMGCPPLQQNPTLCGNVILVCCLPPGGETIAVPDAGEPEDATAPSDAPIEVPDTGKVPVPDAGKVPDAGVKDSGGTPPVDASMPMDASLD